MAEAQAARIDLHAGFHFGRDLEMFSDELIKGANLVWLEESGCAAAEVDLDDRRFGIERGLQELDLALEIGEVLLRAGAVGGHDIRASAVPAFGAAKRQMEIERNLTGVALVGGDAVEDGVGPHVVFELGDRWIGRITGGGDVVFAYDVQIEV